MTRTGFFPAVPASKNNERFVQENEPVGFRSLYKSEGSVFVQKSEPVGFRSLYKSLAVLGVAVAVQRC